MIVVTGAAGFIGSAMIAKLNSEGFKEIIAVDDFSREDKNKNLEGKIIKERVHRNDFKNWFDENGRFIQFIFHLGARTDTTEFDKSIFDKLNLNYTRMIWEKCIDYAVPLVYASSAATYGEGENGYVDDHDIIPQLKPLNPYGDSKNDFDIWALKQKVKPVYWTGIKFFNVFGPNEYHKGRMASVVFHTFNQIAKSDHMNLFQSHRDDYNHGEQKRDFIYIKDVVNVLFYHMNQRNNSGVYNLGTGKARTFNDLATAVFTALNKTPNIDYIPIPEDIRNTYQYFTAANMDKTRNKGYHEPFTSLENAIVDYVQNYLVQNRYL